MTEDELEEIKAGESRCKYCLRKTPDGKDICLACFLKKVSDDGV